MQLAFSNSSINTLREILHDDMYFYAREHHKLFVFTWGWIFSELYTDPMQPRKFSTANNLHYTVVVFSHEIFLPYGMENIF